MSGVEGLRSAKETPLNGGEADDFENEVFSLSVLPGVSWAEARCVLLLLLPLLPPRIRPAVCLAPFPQVFFSAEVASRPHPHWEENANSPPHHPTAPSGYVSRASQPLRAPISSSSPFACPSFPTSLFFLPPPPAPHPPPLFKSLASLRHHGVRQQSFGAVLCRRPAV